MKLLLTGTIPAWLILAAFILFAAYTAVIYRRQNLRPVWMFILCGCRIVAGGLVLVALFQPVLARVRQVTVRGRIPVILDNSGSMSINDSYEGAEGVLSAWQLGLFAPEVRCLAFETARQDITPVRESIARVRASMAAEEIPNAEPKFLQEQ